MRKRPVVAAFERHYTRIHGELKDIATEIVAAGVFSEELEARRGPEIAARHAILRAIELCLRLEEPTWTPDHLDAVNARPRRSPMDRGELLHVAYDILRDAEEPISTNHILEALWLAGKLSHAGARDPQVRSALTGLLRGQERVGAVGSRGQRPLKWSIVIAPGQSRGMAAT